MKFLFCVTDFHMGGITESLKNLSNELLKEGNSVSIINLPNTDTSQFDSRIEIIELKGLSKYWDLNMLDFRRAKGIKKLFMLFCGILKKILSKLNLWESIIFINQPKVECDVAISYRQSKTCYYFSRKKTTAKRTIAFIHSEFDGDCSSWAPYLKKIDRIACVSNVWRDNFKKTFSQYKDKVYTVYNIFDSDELKKKSENFFPNEYNNSCFKIVTSARIDFEQKRLDRIPTICNLLEKKGITDFAWYLVGDGKDRLKLVKFIAENNLRDKVFILGKKENPYPYVKNADLFVLLSPQESYGMVLKEAVILGIPIVTTKFPTSYEVIKENEQGLITDFDEKSIADAITELYNNRELYNKLKKNCEDYVYDSKVVYNQLMDICK